MKLKQTHHSTCMLLMFSCVGIIKEEFTVTFQFCQVTSCSHQYTLSPERATSSRRSISLREMERDNFIQNVSLSHLSLSLSVCWNVIELTASWLGFGSCNILLLPWPATWPRKKCFCVLSLVLCGCERAAWRQQHFKQTAHKDNCLATFECCWVRVFLFLLRRQPILCVILKSNVGFDIIILV